MRHVNIDYTLQLQARLQDSFSSIDERLVALDATLLTEKQKKRFEETSELDLSFRWKKGIRFRANVYRQQGNVAGAIRRIPNQVPSLKDLGLPSIVEGLMMKSAGLVLVTGPTGSGKSTTLASMVDLINRERRCRILTIEDPIEFLHHDRLSTISQRELHTDTTSFARALRSGMRQDPDVVLVGEIRDVDTLRTALQAAETGHLVLASLHARSAVDAVNRVVDLFPVAEQRQARASISESLQGVVCQYLVASADGEGRALVTEVAMRTPRVRDAIADVDKTAQMEDIISEGEYYGMHTFQQDAVRQVLAGRITVEEAERVVPRTADLHVALRRAGYREQIAGTRP